MGVQGHTQKECRRGKKRMALASARGGALGIAILKRCGHRRHECVSEDFSESVRKINVVGMVVIVIVSHHSARACISMLRCDVDTRAYIGFLPRRWDIVARFFLFLLELNKNQLYQQEQETLDSKDFEIPV